MGLADTAAVRSTDRRSCMARAGSRGLSCRVRMVGTGRYSNGRRPRRAETAVSPSGRVPRICRDREPVPFC